MSLEIGLDLLKRSCYVFLARTNIIVISLTIGVQLFTRSIAVTWFYTGAFACMISVKLLKKIIKQPRPKYVNIPTKSGVKKKKKLTYGMPSTHSACITFYATYICGACFYLPLHSSLYTLNTWIPFGLKTVIPPFAISWAVSVIISRVRMEHHTYPQVIVGTLWGATFATFWFALWTFGGVSVVGNKIEEHIWSTLGLT